jgi:hypothetical protein
MIMITIIKHLVSSHRAGTEAGEGGGGLPGICARLFWEGADWALLGGSADHSAVPEAKGTACHLQRALGQPGLHCRAHEQGETTTSI